MPATSARHIFILAGQSNANGNGTFSNVSSGDRTTLPYAKLHHPSRTGFNEFVPSYDVRSGTGPFCGMENWFMRKYYELTGVQPWIIKYASGGTILSRDNPSISWHPAEATLYATLQTNITTAMSWLSSNGFGGDKVRGILWMQGESDAANVLRAGVYGENKVFFMNTLRAWLYAQGYSYDTTPRIVSGQIGVTDLSAFPQRDQVRREQGAAERQLSNFALYDTLGAALESDNTHFSAAGCKTVGEGFATLMAGYV